MAFHFSANQFERPYSAKRLSNWELPKWYPSRPRQRKGSTHIIANDAGHLLPNVKRVDAHPWGHFRSTYQLPNKITRRFGDEYNDCLIGRHRWKDFTQKQQICNDDSKKDHLHGGITGTTIIPECKTKCETIEPIFSADPNRNRSLHPCERKKSFDLEYIPGDFTLPQQQHPSRQLLLERKYERDNNIESDLPLDKLYLGDHECKLADNCGEDIQTPPLPLALSTEDSFDVSAEMPMTTQHSITEKPNERCPSPVIPAYANFELAKRMHHDNLDHQPLPDCVADAAYRKLQINGAHPGLALDIDPIATGVGVKTHNAGPTHCTKMKVYRPATCGVVPKVYKNQSYNSNFTTDVSKKMSPMNLAICWDYKPSNPAAEPQPPKHIDGSDESGGPAVFTYVKSPRENSTAEIGRSAGVFASTHGEPTFFDKDILRRKTDFSGRNIMEDTACECNMDAINPVHRAQSVSRKYTDVGIMPDHLGKRYQSSPNLTCDESYKALREKYLGYDGGCLESTEPACKRTNPGFLRRARSRLCHKVAPEPAACCTISNYESRTPCKRGIFRVGIPKYNAAGHFIGTNNGCGMNSNHANHRVLVIPRPRNPYTKKNYDIDTLVPPFQCFKGGAGEGGYPEHWRLSSVYQHAYKPIEQRRRPLLETVYK